MHQPSLQLRNQIDRAFAAQIPIGDQAERCNAIRARAGELARMLANLCPSSRELHVALTRLEDVVFWSHASILRNEQPTSAVISPPVASFDLRLPDGVNLPALDDLQMVPLNVGPPEQKPVGVA